MKRLVSLAAGIAFLLSTGCTQDKEWSVRKTLGLEDPKARAVMPAPKDLPKPQIEVAERVDQLGRTIIARNTFTGIDPLFHTIGVKELVLFHRGTEELFISEGIVEKCNNDSELAAVLCAELGKMVAEKKAAKKVGRDKDPIPDVNYGGTPTSGNLPFDPSRDAELAFHERKYPRNASTIAADANSTARELLQGAGYSSGELDRVEPLLKNSDRGETLRKQMGGSGPLPTWQK